MHRWLIRAGLAAAAAALLFAPSATLAQDPLVDEFARCEDWYQEPTQPGSTLVACDQAQLDRFIASGLTDPALGGARIDGPEGPEEPVPSVYSSEDPRALRHVRITGAGTATGLYAASYATNGAMRRATFAPVILPKDERLTFSWNDTTATLVSATGEAIATAPVQLDHRSPFHMLARPSRLRARRHGGKVEVSWTGAPRTGYEVLSGATLGKISNVLANTDEHHVVVRLPKGHRWIGVRALRGYRFSRIARIRVR